MKQSVTEAIVLHRTNYGEADRILTLLTPDHGKLSLMAKGVRRVKSKLAGGIELFSVSTVTFVPGRGSVGTLVSTRLVEHYAGIVADLERTMLGYELIRQLHRGTEEHPGPEYFDLLQQSFAALDDNNISQALVDLWFTAQLLRLGGHTPNLYTDAEGRKLEPGSRYAFDSASMCFSERQEGSFDAPAIKFLRLLCSGHRPSAFQGLERADDLVAVCLPLLKNLQTQVV